MDNHETPQGELPQEISRGTFELAPGVTIETIMLDNGQRLITEESLEAFVNFLNAGNTIDADVIERAGLAWKGE